ncbi:hypothetical protein [Streptomyces tendae]|uniref:hypothetical protein n=1 Tax=Streptomyces tendae TaxID=1932 RepID=UPI003EBFB84B
MTQPAEDEQSCGPQATEHRVIADLDPNSTLATSPLRRALARLTPAPTDDTEEKDPS